MRKKTNHLLMEDKNLPKLKEKQERKLYDNR